MTILADDDTEVIVEAPASESTGSDPMSRVNSIAPVAVIAYMVHTGDVAGVRLSGIGPEHFVNPDHRKAHAFVTDHVERYGQVPGCDVMAEQFPDLTLHYQTASVSYLCDRLKEFAARTVFENALMDIAMLPITVDLDVYLERTEQAVVATRHLRAESGSGLGSWDRIDLAALPDEPEYPSVGQRTDGLFVFYTDRVNGVIGLAEAGKSLLMQHMCAQEMSRGRAVVWIDYEDSPHGMRDRLHSFGIDQETYTELFHYIRPEEVMEPRHVDGLARRIEDHKASLIVFDATFGAMNMMGGKLNANDGDDVVDFMRRLPFRLARAELGAAVVMLDHLVKSKDGDGTPAGSVQKINQYNGTLLLVEQDIPFQRGCNGKSTVYVRKDRVGAVREYSLAGFKNGLCNLGEFRVEYVDGMCMPSLVPPPGFTSTTQYRNPHALSERDRVQQCVREVSDAIEGRDWMNQTAIVGVVGKKKQLVIEALGRLVQQGHVECRAGARGAKEYLLKKPIGTAVGVEESVRPVPTGDVATCSRKAN